MASGEETTTRAAFYDRLAPLNLAPLWEVLKGLLPAEPQSKAAPVRWRYSDIRPFLFEAADLLSAEEAERRVLVLENPAFTGQSRITNTLYAGVQVIMPGETAPAHRHTPSALRFMLEGEGAFTAVDGERTSMKPGDFVITPAWTYHDHGNDGDDLCAWLDGLDLPIVQFFESVFTDHYDAPSYPATRPEGDALARYGQALLPLNAESPHGQTSPIFNYPYERTRAALVAAARGEEPDPHTATTLKYANPVDGGWAMPTMATWMSHVPKGFETAPMRSTDGMVLCAAEGRGTIRVGAERFEFGPRDVTVVPGWTWRSIRAEEDCFIFGFSDRAAQEKLGLYGEERAEPA